MAVKNGCKIKKSSLYQNLYKKTKIVCMPCRTDICISVLKIKNFPHFPSTLIDINFTFQIFFCIFFSDMNFKNQ